MIILRVKLKAFINIFGKFINKQRIVFQGESKVISSKHIANLILKMQYDLTTKHIIQINSFFSFFNH